MVKVWNHVLSLALALTLLQCVLSMAMDGSDGGLSDMENTYQLTDDPDVLEEMKKRLSSFVRIGRGLSSFIRIGKSYPIEDLVEQTDDDETGGDAMDKRKSAFVRIGKDGLEFANPEKRLSSFLRIGRGQDEYPMEEKRGGAFIRMGKFPSYAYLRGRNGVLRSFSPSDYYRRSGRIGHSSFIRIGKRDTSDALKQMESERERLSRYIRFGKDLDSEAAALEQPSAENMKRMSSFVRIGKSDGFRPLEQYTRQAGPNIDTPNKRLSSFVRIGKANSNDKRMRSSFVRIGKSDQQDQEPIEIITNTGTASETD